MGLTYTPQATAGRWYSWVCYYFPALLRTLHWCLQPWNRETGGTGWGQSLCDLHGLYPVSWVWLPSSVGHSQFFIVYCLLLPNTHCWLPPVWSFLLGIKHSWPGSSLLLPPLITSNWQFNPESTNASWIIPDQKYSRLGSKTLCNLLRVGYDPGNSDVRNLISGLYVYVLMVFGVGKQLE